MRIIPLTTLAAAAALSVFASSVRAEVSNSPVCESPAPAVRSAGKQVLVGVLLPASGFHNLRGFPKFIVEIHVPPGQVGQARGEAVIGVQKCTYRTADDKTAIVSHVKFQSQLLTEGRWKDHLGTLIELPERAVVDKVLFRTKIGDTRFIGEWKEFEGHPFVLLRKR
ncbi:hypothetical protein A3A38_04760 [Candidatus Kaiserbacteria bacterium RIFCSPLOWO2_01_FULL_53_17]|uniref:DUF4352 domain-containing protein n=1 Tax=Candidatus Kaiserbacteria bacterium RIFCSPLOWO2_01_FULL_53_17 TaxID=1798511 RepID=A0A1F6EIM9_9BACT|nr:MAG: hypothetical protein A3A38_04760 [Candidatus Kaiserbacteria bacterium RIFCSPLOWO2_01_FULL_53_17]